jgi:hypothetical protein
VEISGNLCDFLYRKSVRICGQNKNSSPAAPLPYLLYLRDLHDFIPPADLADSADK